MTTFSNNELSHKPKMMALSPSEFIEGEHEQKAKRGETKGKRKKPEDKKKGKKRKRNDVRKQRKKGAQKE